MSKNKLLSPLLIAAAFTAPSLQAQTVTLGLNNDSIETNLRVPMSNASQGSLDYLYQQDNGKVLSVGFQVTNRTPSDSSALGAKALKLWSDKRENGHALAIGGDYSFFVSNELTAIGALYYAPSVLSGSGVDRFTHLDAKLAYRVMPNANLAVGYRYVNFRFDNDSAFTLDSGLYLAATLNF